MDTCARIRGVPLKTRAAIRKEAIRDGSVPLLKSLLKSRKELSGVSVGLHSGDLPWLTEIHFVGLPSHSDVEDLLSQALPAVPVDVLELLRSLRTQSLKDEEVLLLEDTRKLLENKGSVSQATCSKAICVFRHCRNPQSIVGTMSTLLTRYMAGMKYALELQCLQKGVSDGCPLEDDDTNQSVSSIEDDFVTAFEHLEEEEVADNLSFHNQRNQRDVGSQTVPSHSKDLSGSRLIISSFSKKPSVKKSSFPETLSSSGPAWNPGEGSQWDFYTPGCLTKASVTAASATESDESDCSSPSPIIFLDEVSYQKSLKAKLDIPKIPVFKDGVEDSDSEVSEFFDSFDQFDDLDQALESSSKFLKEPAAASQTQRNIYAEDSKCMSRGFSSKAMNPHRFDHPTLPANIKKPTPLKPGSLCGSHSDIPDSPRPVRTITDETGVLFSPVRSSAFSPLGEGSTLEYFWKPDGDGELRKPQDLCTLYKTYSDFANNMSTEILRSVCGYSTPVDMNVNKNLSCVCHKEFKNSSGHLMKLSDIQETVTISKSQKSQTLKEGIQKFATDLVEMSLGSAFRDLQKGVSSCTTTLCHLAARLTSSVFQMAFHEIGMRHAFVLKERAINGLASFLVKEAVSGALKEFHFVKKQIFNNTVARFAAELAEELVFEGIMEVCQFSHPSTPLTPSDWSFEQEEEVVSSYASDLSESVLQEAFIELSQADVTFTTQAAISVSLDNIRYVSSDDAAETTKTCNATSHYLGSTTEVLESTENDCTVRRALFCMSGIASCVPVPVAGKAISQFQGPVDTCQYKSSICQTSQTSPKKSSCLEGRLVTSVSEISTATQTDLVPVASQSVYNETGTTEPVVSIGSHETVSGNQISNKSNLQNYSGNMADMIVSEAYELMTASKVKKSENGADKTIGNQIPSSYQLMPQNLVNENVTSSTTKHPAIKGTSHFSIPTEADFFLMNKKDRTDQHGMHLRLQDSMSHCFGFYDKYNKPKSTGCQKRVDGFDHPPPSSLIPNSGSRGMCRDTYGSDLRNIGQVTETASEMRSSLMKDTLEVPSFEAPNRSGKKMSAEEIPCTSGRKTHGVPGTPPSTPQLPLPGSREKHFKQFSKKLKGKLAKEFSPATPPSTPHYQPALGLVEANTDSEKADFLLKLMRSLSEEAENNEDREDRQYDISRIGTQAGAQADQYVPVETDNKVVEKGAFHYAERLACHIVSMATEMDTLALPHGWKSEDKPCTENHTLHSAKFSEQTLSSLWTYAGEIAGEVISDVKKMISSSQYRRKTIMSNKDVVADSRQNQPLSCKSNRFGSLANHFQSDSMVQGPNFQVSGSSGLSSKCPSCESVTDEYSGYIIKVLKKEGGSRELILDQYASRLAYRSIKSGLAHAAKKIKQRSNLKLHPSRRPHCDGTHEVWRGLMSEASSVDDNRKASSSDEAARCTCQNPEDLNRKEYLELVNFAESLAYDITCDVTRKLRMSSVRLPKSLTDSCLYKKSKLDDVTDSPMKTHFSCSLLPFKEKTKQYHSTGSLNDRNYSDSVMQVIEHYARKIVDDTLEITLASAMPQDSEDRGLLDQNSYAEKLTKTALSSALADQACRYCAVRKRSLCRNASRQHFQDSLSRQRQDFEAVAGTGYKGPRVCGLEIPKIHIDLEKRAAYAEEVVSSAIEKAKRELSSASLNADSGIGHDGASFAESLTTEIMTSAISNVCQTINLSPGKEGMHTLESAASQQLCLSVGDDSIGSWSNLSFEEEHPDESSSFLHLSDSNGNSSSWSSLGLEGEIYEEHLSFSPSDSDSTEDKETEAKAELDGGPHAERGLLVVNVDVGEPVLDSQVRAMLQWIAASQTGLPAVQLELQQLPAVLQRVLEREWKVGELLQVLIRYCDELASEADTESSGESCESKPFFQWLMENA
ncbi:A-kinase anchor protein 11 isoform X2 [Brienomyrus brachyistius]|uniref:A-kinase anchor protein 11 isoform X2 n=1 Tax=Brienomyrus brachyistius TaxID=42636 RepID=UPI0020B2FE09|nr:A-kinase anchor protein 11 isoform X2 [Brienomyrus brachyistius]